MNTTMVRWLLTGIFLCCTSCACLAGEGGAGPAGGGSPEVRELQERMLNDAQIVNLIRDLGNDPEMQALLSDPKVLEAVQAGDMGVLLQNPRFMRMLNNPRVQEIGKRLENQEGGGAK